MKKLLNNSTAIKYLLTGGLAFTVDYLLLVTSYYLLSFPLWLATTLGYLGGMGVSFSVNRIWVYSKTGRQRRMTKQLIEYALLLLFNYAFTVYSIKWLNSVGITPAISKVVVTGMIVCWNYLIFTKIIFTNAEDS